jgi:hypothetical protein
MPLPDHLKGIAAMQMFVAVVERAGVEGEEEIIIPIRVARLIISEYEHEVREKARALSGG